MIIIKYQLTKGKLIKWPDLAQYFCESLQSVDKCGFGFMVVI